MNIPSKDNPLKKYKLVVSDFHLGKGRFFENGTQNILEDFIYDREFSEFLNYYRTGDYASAEVEIILNGDILNLLQMDTWGVFTHLVTERSVVRAIQSIIKGHPIFFNALKHFANTPFHSIAYVIGNHDAGMLWPEAKKAFAQAVKASVNFYDVSYHFDGVYVEHGQQYEKFAKIDMNNPFIVRGLPEPVLNLPWGSLFVAVQLPKIKISRSYIDKVRPTSALMRWVLIHDFLWGIKTSIGVLKFIFDTVLFKRRYQIRQGVKATLSLLKEISLYPNYDKIAFKILETREDVHTVIFGHTHVIRYRQWREGKEYFNEGTWNETTNLDLNDYGKQIRLSYAHIEYPEVLESDSTHVFSQEQYEKALAEGNVGDTPFLKKKPKVRLKQWFGNWKAEVEVLA